MVNIWHLFERVEKKLIQPCKGIVVFCTCHSSSQEACQCTFDKIEFFSLAQDWTFEGMGPLTSWVVEIFVFHGWGKGIQLLDCR